jgi:hypothetical protein
VEHYSFQWTGFKIATALKRIRKQSLPKIKQNIFVSPCLHGLGILMPVLASSSVFVVFL